MMWMVLLLTENWCLVEISADYSVTADLWFLVLTEFITCRKYNISISISSYFVTKHVLLCNSWNHQPLFTDYPFYWFFFRSLTCPYCNIIQVEFLYPFAGYIETMCLHCAFIFFELENILFTWLQFLLFNGLKAYILEWDKCCFCKEIS